MDPHGQRAVRALLRRATDLREEGRYPEALRAAHSAREMVENADDPGLLAETLEAEAWALNLMGDNMRVLARATRILSMAGSLPGAQADTVAYGYRLWLIATRWMTAIPLADKLRMADEADSWARSAGLKAEEITFRSERAQILAEAGRLSEAHAMAAQALAAARSHLGSRSSKARQIALDLAWIALQEENWSLARELSLQVLDAPYCSEMQRVRALRNLSEAAVATGDAAEGCSHAERAVDGSRKMGAQAMSWSLVILARALEACGDTEKAAVTHSERVALARQVAASRPADCFAHGTLGDALFDQQDYASALAAYDHAAELAPHEHQFQLGRGAALYELGRYEETLPPLRLALQSDPHNSRAHHFLAAALKRMGRHAEALDSYDQAIASHPGGSAIHNDRANLLRLLKRHDEALAAHEKAIELSPGKAAYHLAKSETLSDTGRHQERLTACEEALRLAPDHAAAHFEKAKSLEFLERYEEALASHDRAIELDPTRAVYHMQRAVSLSYLDRYEEAVGEYDRAIELEPGNAELHGRRALALNHLGRYEEGLDAADRAIGLGRADEVIHYRRAVALAGLGRHEEALASYDRALGLKQDWAWLRCRRALALSALERDEEALHEARLAADLDPAEPYFGQVCVQIEADMAAASDDQSGETALRSEEPS